jgi:hypothetical protein
MNRSAFLRRSPIIKRTPLKRTPIRRLPRRIKAGDDPDYREFIRQLPCVVCYRNWPLAEVAPAIVEASLLAGRNQSECAHVGVRGLGQLCPDRETLPLCGLVHHREGPESHHRLQGEFWTFHGLDRPALFRALQEFYNFQI